MAMPVDLYDYQRELLERAEAALADPAARIMLQLPTGGGKTHVAGALLSRRLGGGRKAVWLTHRKELASQTQGMLRRAPVCATANMTWDYRTAVDAPAIPNGVVILMAQTVGRRNARTSVWGHYGASDLLIIDEAHHAPARGWARAIDQWPGPVLGMTATPWRLSTKQGFNRLFTKLHCGPQVAELQEGNRLCKTRVLMPTEEELFQSGQVDSKTGDYSEGDIERVNESRDVWTAGALRFWQRHCKDRQTVVYAVSKGHAQNLVDEFSEAGISVGLLLGDTPSEKRATLVKQFKAGTMRVLVNMAVATEGFDLPDASCVLITRPTLSLALYLQMVGRGMRRKANGGDCVILDMAGNSLEHGLPEEEREWSLWPRGEQSSGDPVVVRCPVCESVSPAASHHCGRCGAALGECCDRCGNWRAWKGWRIKTMCGKTHDLVCDRCHNDAHVRAWLPVIEEEAMEALATMEPSHEDIKERFKAIKEELEGRLSPQGIFDASQRGEDFDALSRERRDVVEEQNRLRPIALGEEILKARQELADEIAKIVEESRLEELLGESVRNLIYSGGDIGELYINVDWQELQQRRQVFEVQTQEAGLLPRGRTYETPQPRQSSPENRQALDERGWHPLSELTYSESSPNPAEMCFPDGSRVLVRRWYHLMVETTRWLIDNQHLESRHCPISVSRKRHLVSTTPYHPGGKPMRNGKQVNSLYVEGHYQAISCIRNAQTIISRVGQHPAQFHVRLG